MSSEVAPGGIEFVVYGNAVPQGSKRVLRGNLVDMSGARLRAYRQDIHLTALQEMKGPPYVEPVFVSVVFAVPRPKSHYGTGRNAAIRKRGLPRSPAKPPDIDKLGRAVLDGLTGAAFKDDAQVVSLVLNKVWADHSDAATTVRVYSI